jgi:hypothetical protein
MKKKVQGIFLQIPYWSSFLPKHSAQIDQKTLPRSRIMHRTSKNNIVAHPIDHGNAHFGPTQQPTNNPAALI